MKHDNKNAVTIERMRILYETVHRLNIVTIAATIIIVYIYRDQFSNTLLAAWSGFMMFGVGARVWCLLNYRKNADKFTDHSRFEKEFTYATLVIGFGWALFIIFSD